MTGRALTPEAKKAICARLFRVWMRVPEQRLGQLIANYAGNLNELFAREDEEFVRVLEAKVPTPKDSK